jgi:hypothetical protein
MKRFFVIILVAFLLIFGGVTYAASTLDSKTQIISHTIDFPSGSIEITENVKVESNDNSIFDGWIGDIVVFTNSPAILHIQANPDNYSRFGLKLVCTSGNAGDLEIFENKAANIEFNTSGKYTFHEKLICFSSGIESHETEIIFDLLEDKK